MFRRSEAPNGRGNVDKGLAFASAMEVAAQVGDCSKREEPAKVAEETLMEIEKTISTQSPTEED